MYTQPQAPAHKKAHRMRQCLEAMHVRVALISQATETSFNER